MSTAPIAVSAEVGFRGRVYTAEDVRKATRIYATKPFAHVRQGNDYQVSVDGQTYAPKKLVHCMSALSFDDLDSPSCRLLLSQLGFMPHRMSGR